MPATTDPTEDLLTAKDLIEELEELIKQPVNLEEITSTLAELFIDLSDDLVDPALIGRVKTIIEFINQQPSLWGIEVQHEKFKKTTLFMAFIVFLCYPTILFLLRQSPDQPMLDKIRYLNTVAIINRAGRYTLYHFANGKTPLKEEITDKALLAHLSTLEFTNSTCSNDENQHFYDLLAKNNIHIGHNYDNQQWVTIAYRVFRVARNSSAWEQVSCSNAEVKFTPFSLLIQELSHDQKIDNDMFPKCVITDISRNNPNLWLEGTRTHQKEWLSTPLFHIVDSIHSNPSGFFATQGCKLLLDNFEAIPAAAWTQSVTQEGRQLILFVEFLSLLQDNVSDPAYKPLLLKVIDLIHQTDQLALWSKPCEQLEGGTPLLFLTSFLYHHASDNDEDYFLVLQQLADQLQVGAWLQTHHAADAEDSDTNSLIELALLIQQTASPILLATFKTIAHKINATGLFYAWTDKVSHGIHKNETALQYLTGLLDKFPHDEELRALVNDTNKAIPVESERPTSVTQSTRHDSVEHPAPLEDGHESESDAETTPYEDNFQRLYDGWFKPFRKNKFTEAVAALSTLVIANQQGDIRAEGTLDLPSLLVTTSNSILKTLFNHPFSQTLTKLQDEFPESKNGNSVHLPAEAIYKFHTDKSEIVAWCHLIHDAAENITKLHALTPTDPALRKADTALLHAKSVIATLLRVDACLHKNICRTLSQPSTAKRSQPVNTTKAILSKLTDIRDGECVSVDNLQLESKSIGRITFQPCHPEHLLPQTHPDKKATGPKAGLPLTVIKKRRTDWADIENSDKEDETGSYPLTQRTTLFAAQNAEERTGGTGGTEEEGICLSR